MIMHTHTRRTLARPAFTLMEMLVVVAIIVALAGIGGYFYLNQAHNSRVATARTQMKVLESAINTYQLNVGKRPEKLEELFNTNVPGGPFLSEARAIIDPWGQQYIYDMNGAMNANHGNIKADIASVGSGKTIGNWE